MPGETLDLLIDEVCRLVKIGNRAMAKPSSKELVSKKIGKLVKEGVPQDQAVATAISMGKKGRITPSGGYRRVGKKGK